MKIVNCTWDSELARLSTYGAQEIVNEQISLFIHNYNNVFFL